jgi:hypothetical protein
LFVLLPKWMECQWTSAGPDAKLELSICPRQMVIRPCRTCKMAYMLCSCPFMPHQKLTITFLRSVKGADHIFALYMHAKSDDDRRRKRWISLRSTGATYVRIYLRRGLTCFSIAFNGGDCNITVVSDFSSLFYQLVRPSERKTGPCHPFVSWTRQQSPCYVYTARKTCTPSAQL